MSVITDNPRETCFDGISRPDHHRYAMKKILLVEDDPIIVRIYQNKLQIEGFSVDTASDGESALAFLTKELPDLILLDLQLPKLSGIDVLKRIRSQLSQTVPVIVFTNSFLTDVIQEAWKAGATKCLMKSNCPPKKLLEEVASALLARTSSTILELGPKAMAATLPGSGLVPGLSDSSQSDAALQLQFRQTAQRELGMFQRQLQSLIHNRTEAMRAGQPSELARCMGSIAAQAGVAGYSDAGILASALEALLKEFATKPASLNASTLRTVSQALDTLNCLVKEAAPEEHDVLASTLVLAIDDDTICRRAIRTALDRARLRLITVADAAMGLSLLSENRFDLIFVDIEMPGTTGLEFCAKARGLTAYRNIPIVFVTRLDDIDSRVQTLETGGSGLIGKPFPLAEMALKALTYLLGKPGTRRH